MSPLRAFLMPREIAALAIVIITTTLFSVTFLMDKSLRLDEAQSLSQTGHSFIGTIYAIASDVHVPLYFAGLWAWQMLFGPSVEAIRAFSLVFLLAAFPALYLLAERAFGRTVALTALALAAVSPFLHWFGSEARMYTLLLFLTIVNQFAFISIWKGKTELERGTAWTLYLLSVILGVLSHFFFTFVLLAQIIFFFAYKKLFPPGALLRFGMIAMVASATLGAWLLFRASVSKGDTTPLLLPPSSIDVFNILSHFLIGFQSDLINTFFLALWPLLVFGGLTILSRRKPMQPETVYLLLSVFVPIVTVFFISSVFRPLFLSRYLIICLPALYILIASYFWLYAPKVRNILIAGTVLFLGGSLLVQAISPSVPVNEEYRSAAAYVSLTAEYDDVFIVTAPFTTYPIEYYYDGAATLVTFPAWRRYESDEGYPPYSEPYAKDYFTNLADVYEKMYILMSYDQGFEEELRLYLDTHYQKLETREFSPGLTLSVYQLRYLD